MNITFLIGNGFDLNLGLKTQFKDFINKYTESDTTDDNIRAFRNIIDKDKKTWASAELAFGQYTDNNLWNDIELDAELYSDCHEDFCMKLGDYLQKQERRLNYDLVQDELAKRFIHAIRSFTSGFKDVPRRQIQEKIDSYNGGFVYNFINFNYTETLDRCLSRGKVIQDNIGLRKQHNTTYVSSIGKHYHVHGYTNRGNMVLGVNDESQIKNVALFENKGEEFINQIIKIKANEMNEENTDANVHNLLKNSDLFYIYGMSIGETDALWWQRIIDVLNSKSNAIVIIHCFDAPTDSYLQRKIQTFKRERVEKFLAYSNLDNARKAQLKSRIYIDTSNIFDTLHNLVDSELNDPNIINLEIINPSELNKIAKDTKELLNSGALDDIKYLVQNKDMRNAIELANKVKQK